MSSNVINTLNVEMLTNVVSAATLRVIVYILLVCCLSSSISALFEWMYPISEKTKYGRNRCMNEDETFADLNKDELPIKYVQSGNIDLIGVDGSLLTGRASTYVHDGETHFEMEGFLPKIDGDVLIPRQFTKEPSSSYVAYFDGIAVGKLRNDGDGVYRLKGTVSKEMTQGVIQVYIESTKGERSLVLHASSA